MKHLIPFCFMLLLSISLNAQINPVDKLRSSEDVDVSILDVLSTGKHRYHSTPIGVLGIFAISMMYETASLKPLLPDNFNSSSDISRWYDDSIDQSILVHPIQYYESLGTINYEKVTTTMLPNPAIYSVSEINLMLQLFSGGVRLFYPTNYSIDFANNKLIFPFDQGGENAHLIFTKFCY